MAGITKEHFRKLRSLHRKVYDTIEACQRVIQLLLDDETRATPGPWICSGNGMVTSQQVDDDGTEWGDLLPDGCVFNDDDALICASRNLHRPMLEYLQSELDGIAKCIKVTDDLCLYEPDVYYTGAVTTIASILAQSPYGEEIRELLEECNAR